jgi:triphosphoribosyl-dephospho-CoA synthetase
VNRGQKSTDQQHQQIDFHDFLRCAIAANPYRNAKAVPLGSMTVIG